MYLLESHGITNDVMSRPAAFDHAAMSSSYPLRPLPMPAMNARMPRLNAGFAHRVLTAPRIQTPLR